MTAANAEKATSGATPADPQSADVRFVRLLSFVEGLSLLALIFIAMPLKYAAGLPMAVRIVGMAHGLLFVALVVALARAHFEQDWKLGRSLRLLALSFLPFGFVLMERDLRRG